MICGFQRQFPAFGFKHEEKRNMSGEHSCFCVEPGTLVRERALEDPGADKILPKEQQLRNVYTSYIQPRQCLID